MKFFATTALSALAVASSSESSAVVDGGASCTALVIGGLGSQQAYVAGALSTLAKSGVEYDVVVSTSASLVAAQAAAAGPTTAEFASAALKTVNSATNDAMYAKNPAGSSAAINQDSGIYNATASASVYAGILANHSGTNDRTVVAVAVSLTDTLQTPLPVSTADVPNSVAGLMASAADPLTYEVVQANFDGRVDAFVSGEVRGQVNVFEAISQCRAKGAADADITVDVIYTTSSFLLKRSVAHDNTLLVQTRSENIGKFVAAQRDVLYAKFAYPSVNFRYDVSPPFGLLTASTDYNAIGPVSYTHLTLPTIYSV